MVPDHPQPEWKNILRSNTLLSSGIGIAFFGLSIISRSAYSLFSLVVLIGIGFPLAWDRASQDWQSLGFRKRNLKGSILWGLGAGIASSLIGLLVLRELAVPKDLGKQLLLGIPFWFLVISPFQEFFFRGWLQSRLSASLGKWAGLLLANIGFTAWHYFSPIIDLAPYPLASLAGVGSTFIAGLLYGYAFQRSQNIIAPWIGHAISGIAFIIAGTMDFSQMIK